ncbi:MAG: SAM-dependent methyltransferase [Anaerolineales bacterium]|nr:SAM-dependent methyltransferase [Anaerolineales bacterium]
MSKNIELHPIGVIRAGEDGFRLEIEEKYRPAVSGLEGFGHATVLWWPHKRDNPENRNILEVAKPYKKAPAILGIFATRSEARPNPVLVTTVPLLHVDAKEGLLVTPYIDAEDGSPILDIKPYQPCIDRIRDTRQPEWCRHWPQYAEDSAAFDWESEFLFPG